ncbi:MAG: ABC transporter ATP-binding protein [Bacteroidota bacterium]
MSITFQSAGFSYPGGAPALRNISLEVPAGDFLLVTGHNGAGKSTLLRLLNGMLKPDTGCILVDGFDTRSTPVSRLAAIVSVTFQHPGDQIFASTVLDEVRFGPRHLRHPDPGRACSDALSLLGLEAFSSWHPYDLSAAHRKLLTVASAVATGAPFLAFDEPTVHLSQPERVILANALRHLVKAGRSFVIISHDLEFFLPITKRILLLRAGEVSFLGDRRDIDRYATLARKSGVRLPYSFRLRPHVGLPLLPD